MIPFKTVSIFLLMLFVLTLSACALIGGGEEGNNPAVTVFGDQQSLGGGATLLCTQECSDRGFCGTRDTGERVVLLTSQGPSTLNYDMFVLDNTPVSIMAVIQQAALLTQSLQPITVNYYQVDIPNLGQGWVAGWCVGQ